MHIIFNCAFLFSTTNCGVLTSISNSLLQCPHCNVANREVVPMHVHHYQNSQQLY